MSGWNDKFSMRSMADVDSFSKFMIELFINFAERLPVI